MRVRLLLPSLVLALSFPLTTHAATYYVDAAQGVDTNSGLTPATAWKTLNKVNAKMDDNTIVAGTQVLFERGETFTGYLDVDRGGTAGNELVFGAYGSGSTVNPIINATGLQNGIDIRTLSHIRFQDLTVQGAATRCVFLYQSAAFITMERLTMRSCPTAINLLTGSFTGITLTDSTVRATNTGYGSSAHQTGITIRNTSFSGGTTGISIDGRTTNVSGVFLENVSTIGHANYGVYLRGVDDATIDGLVTSGNNKGAWIEDFGRNLALRNSSFLLNRQYGLQLSEMTNVLIENTSFSGNTLDGLNASYFLTGVTLLNIQALKNRSNGIAIAGAKNVILSGATLAGNTNNGLSAEGTAAGSGMIVFNVTAAKNLNDGFGVRGGWRNVTFDRSVAEENGEDGIGADGDGISFHEATTGIIRNCLFLNNKKSGVAHVDTSNVRHTNNTFIATTTTPSIGMVWFSDGGLRTLEHSTIYSSLPSGIGIMSSSPNAVIRNNIVSGFAYGLGAHATSQADYNLYFNQANTTYYLASTPHGAHDVLSDPLFTDSGSLDLSLSPGSPAIDAGIDAGVPFDVLGGARVDDPATVNTGTGTIGFTDIGIIEFQPTAEEEPEAILLDSSGAEFSSIGFWYNETAPAYAGQCLGGDAKLNVMLPSQEGAPASSATWELSLGAPQTYEVWISWSPVTYGGVLPLSASVPVTVSDGATELASTMIDQQQMPATFADGAFWDSLGTFTFSESAKVSLRNPANSALTLVMADAVRLVPAQ